MSQAAEQIIDYILREIVRRPGVTINESTPLVSSGLIDSLSLVDILHKVEEATKTRIPPGKVQARDMDTVELMLATAARVGKKRQ